MGFIPGAPPVSLPPMEIFWRVTRRVLEGCGRDAAKLRQSRRYRDVCLRFRRLSGKRGALGEFGKFHRLGSVALAHEFYCAPLNGMQKLPVLKSRADPRVLAWLEIIGDALLKAAQATIPKMLKVDGVYRLPKPLRDFGSLKTSDIMKAWHKAGASFQRAVLLVLMTTVREDVPGPSDEQIPDDLNQPPERVLPIYWGANSAFEPNCFGKTLRVAAFGQAVGARMVVLSPIRAPGIMHHGARVEAAIAIQQLYAECGISLPEVAMRKLLAVISDAEMATRPESGLHYGVAMQLSDGKWMVVDPNYSYANDLLEMEDLSRSWRWYEKLWQVLPGFHCYHGVPDKYSPNQIQQARAEFLHYRDLMVLSNKSATVDEIIAALERSSALDEALTWREFGPGELPPESPRRKKAICVLLEMLIDRAGEREDRSFLWFAGVKTYSEARLQVELDETKALRALKLLLFRLACKALRAIDEHYEREHFRQRGLPSQYQLGSIRTGLAIPALCHVALEMGYADEMEALLLYYTNCMHRLVSAAGRVYRGLSHVSELDRAATQVLRELPTKTFRGQVLTEALFPEVGVHPPFFQSLPGG